jgi:hypothetical protein
MRRGANNRFRMIAEASIASFLSPDSDERREAVDRQTPGPDRPASDDRQERDIGIAVETLAVFIRFWLCHHAALAGTRCALRRAPKRRNATSPS